MPRTIDLMLAAVRLDWRLSVAAARAEPGGVLLPALVGALILSNLSGSVASAALLAQADPAFGTAILSTYAWTTAAAAAGLALAVGQPALAQRVTDQLRIAPVSVPQMFLALQALTAAGALPGDCRSCVDPAGAAGRDAAAAAARSGRRRRVAGRAVDAARVDSSGQRHTAKTQLSDAVRAWRRRRYTRRAVEPVGCGSGRARGAAPGRDGAYRHRRLDPCHVAAAGRVGDAPPAR